MPEADHDALCRRVAAAAGDRFPGAGVASLSRLPGGRSSDTYAAALDHDAGRSEVVLKVAPPGLPPTHNRDVLRQARILDALADVAGFPVPAVLLRDSGEPPEVPPLFGMARAPGDAYEPRVDVAERPPSASTAAQRMRAAARALAALHAVEPAALGLGDVAVTGLDEELARWARLLATVDADLGPGHEDLQRRLRARVPPALPARVHHGDYRVGNMLCVDAELRAVIDWEIWSVGDPRWDLAWLALHTAPVHRFHERRPAADEAAGSRLPSPGAVVAEYVAAGGAEPSDLAWFVAASHFKGVAVMAALVKRERRRADPDPQTMTAAADLDRMLEAGHRALDDPARTTDAK